jgi:hypothetical protein
MHKVKGSDVIFSTKQSTKYRTGIVAVLAIVIAIFVASANSTAPPYTVSLMITVPIATPLIYLDVSTIQKTHADFTGKYIYPLCSILGGLGLLLYLWDRERNLPNQN